MKAASPPVFRLRRQARAVALILHVLTSVGWFGIAVAIVACTVAARTTTEPAFAHALYRVVAASPSLSVPAGLIAVATGVLMGLGTRFGLIRHWWVIVKTLLALVVIAADALLVSAPASQALATAEATPALYGSTAGHIILLAIATALSVIKPPGLTRWGRRAIAVPQSTVDREGRFAGQGT